MEKPQLAEAAQQLLEAYRTRVPIEPLVTQYPDLDVEAAYEIQQFQVRAWLDEGRVLKGHKVGLTSAAMRQQMGVDQPDSGVLRDDMFHPEFEPIAADAFVQPRVEPEIAFVLRSDLAGPGVTVPEAAAAVDFMLPSIEIIDSRIRDWKITIADTVADNASSGGVVLGTRPVPVSAQDLRLTGCNLSHNGRLVATGTGGAVLGTPLNALVWLANTVGALGTVLRAGQVILPGSITAAQPVSPGDSWTAEFAGIGSVTAFFAEGES